MMTREEIGIVLNRVKQNYPPNSGGGRALVTCYQELMKEYSEKRNTRPEVEKEELEDK